MVITSVGPNGLDEAMARAIASKGPSLLVITARSTGKAEAVFKQLRVDFPSTEIQVFSLDPSSQKSAREAATELGDRTESVDVLINNTGVMAVSEITLSEDGEELQFAPPTWGTFCSRT